MSRRGMLNVRYMNSRAHLEEQAVDWGLILLLFSADKVTPVTPLRRMGTLGLSPFILNRGTGLKSVFRFRSRLLYPSKKKVPFQCAGMIPSYLHTGSSTHRDCTHKTFPDCVHCTVHTFTDLTTSIYSNCNNLPHFTTF